jgi:hypothetical protein
MIGCGWGIVVVDLLALKNKIILPSLLLCMKKMGLRGAGLFQSAPVPFLPLATGRFYKEISDRGTKKRILSYHDV